MVASLLGLLLVLFQFVLIARVVVDWIEVLGSGRGGTALVTARRVTHTLTEPVVGPVRRVMGTVRMGNVGLDLSVVVVFLIILVLRVVVVPLIPF
ncbi:MAG: YggT family protein [Pseudonocardia sediminis]